MTARPARRAPSERTDRQLVATDSSDQTQPIRVVFAAVSGTVTAVAEKASTIRHDRIATPLSAA